MKRAVFLLLLLLSPLMGIASTQTPNQQTGTLNPTQLQALIPATVYFSGQMATVQLRMDPPPMPQPPAQMQEIHEDPALAARMADDPAFDPADPDGGGVTTLSRPRVNPQVDPNDPATWGKVARNAPCPCGSGKKFKHCHGRV